MELALAHETVARWQFGITTVYHFLFVPLTISLSAFVAGLQTAWVRTGKDKYFRATKFWGKLLVINIAMGVVTGILQEFQFGMNWSDYSRFVGDVFGAPLAMEALLAFFFESTFIGLWIFGWDKLPKKLHCACIWIVAVGTVLSAYFILAANSWMQHPVGYRINPATGRTELTDIGRVLFQDTTLVVVFHTLTAAFLTGGAFMIGISAYLLVGQARRKTADRDPRTISALRSSLRLGLIAAVVFGLLTAVSGDRLGKVMFEQQPMKMAAAEALWDTDKPAPFSLFAYGDVEKGHNTVAVEIPSLLSFLAKDSFSAEVPGINDVAAHEKALFGDKAPDYRPSIPTTYWAFRWMIGFGLASFAIGVLGLWLTRRRLWLAPELRRADDELPVLALTRGRPLGPFLTRWSIRLAVLTMGFPLIANSWGWIFTEMGRQPWSVYGLMTTANAVSPGVSTGEQVTSLGVYTLLYAVLAIIEVGLLVKYVKAGPPDEEPPAGDIRLRRGPGEETDEPLAFAY
ncbi:cytochrome ubiquinol oxidase subunit I [Streptomyces abikoensis]|uniref:cytochrome ubiquinol oxidase subunit I n=1 Tax=Streptomyces abikoensis TaxID=97398 RepID=UPI001672006D|nr:cytochrome ubiquinol oxidase subunit I [Streptomyces abikoensis]GGP34079.1 cytochrome ubiquinol oxidase subunit I [Streptomyces abikoensis]